MASTFGYPVLNLVSIPLTLYSARPDFEQAWASLFISRRIRWSVVWSFIVIYALATQRYLFASIFTWFRDASALLTDQVRSLFMELDESSRQILAQVYGAKPRTAWMLVRGMEVEVPLEDVQVGDVVVVSAGEMIPVEGTAALSAFESRPIPKGPGDHVFATTRVLSGRIIIRVDKH